MGRRLLLGDRAVVDQLLDEGVVAGELGDPALPQQVGPGVADVGDVQSASLEERGRERRPHALQVGVVLRCLHDDPVGLDDGVLEGVASLLVITEDAAVEACDRFQREGRRDLTSSVAAHAVGDGEDRVTDEHGVLVARAALADVGEPGGVEADHRRTSRRVLPSWSWSPAATAVGAITFCPLR